MKVWIVAAAGSEATEHLKRTIEKPVSYEELPKNLRESLELPCKGPYYLWGAIPGPNNEKYWEEMKKGDICIFYIKGKKFGYWGKIRHKIRNKELAKFLWGTDKNGNTWELIYFIDYPRKIDLPLNEFNLKHNYKPNFTPQNLLPISDEKVEKIEEEYGSYENFLRQYEIEPTKNTKTVASDRYVEMLEELYQKEFQIALKELEKGKNIILYGPPGSGKTILAKLLAERYSAENDGCGYILYTVHSGTDFFDLVARIMPQVENGTLTYKKEPRYLIKAITQKKVLILDEINRTQIDTSLGIFFTYLEKEHRLKDVEAIHEIIKEETDIDIPIDKLKEKLDFFRIIGTLNSYDKTFLFKLGDALRRRFRFIEITTTEEILDKIKNNYGTFLDVIGYSKDTPEKDGVATALISIFSEINKIKELGIGVLKDLLLFSENFSDPKEAIEESVINVLLPFFENDILFKKVENVLKDFKLENAVRKLRRLNNAIQAFE